jgi:hypothetical protein
LLQLSLIDPLQIYLNELRDAFGDVALFFADIYGGDKIAIVWLNGSLLDTQFKVNFAFNVKPTKKEKVSE